MANKNHLAGAFYDDVPLNLICFDIAQGLDINDRIGNQISIKAVFIKWSISKTIGGGSLSCEYVRVGVYQDLQQLADAAPTLQTVYEEGGGEPFAYRFFETVGRFKVLWQRTFRLTTDFCQFKLSTAIKFPGAGLLVRFNGPASNDIQKNGLYIFAQSQNVLAEANTINVRMRVRFTDS